VLHHALPDCLESYYQQVGRAGRDGLRADCLLLFGRQEIGTVAHFIEQGAPSERVGRMARLQAMIRYAESTACRRRTLLTYFGDPPPDGPCGMCDNCLAEAAGRKPTDVSEEARWFLQCVEQTRERFGRGHLVDVLRGSQNARVLKWRHHELAVYGAGRAHSAERWRLLADRFIEQELVEVELEHGTLRLTAAGRRALAGEPVLVFLEEPKPAPTARADAPRDPVLFEALRRLRKELADEAGLPPYVIFSDRSLAEMAAHYPRTREEFLRIHGVGERRAESYGVPFLEAIRRHVEEHGITPAPVPPAPSPESGAGHRAREVGEAFREGADLAALRERWGVTTETLVRHLLAYLRAGGALDAGRLLAECRLPAPQRARVMALFDELGDERLGPVFAALHGAVPYLELHLLRLYRMALAAADEPTPPAGS
jgi:ATP-dependent DNA helicase RecQ